MSAARIRRLTLTNFRSYHAAQHRRSRPARRAGRAQRRRQDQSDRGDLVPDAGTWAAPRHARGGRVPGRRRLLGGVGRGRRRARPRHARHRHRAAGGAGHGDRAQMPHRPRAGGLGGGLRRPSAGDLAGAGDGRDVQRARLRAAPFSRPPGAGGRCRAFRPGRRARAGAALAQPAAGGARAPTRTGSTRSSTRPPRSRSRSRRSAPRRCARLQQALAARDDPASAFPVGRDRARRLDRGADAASIRPSRWRTATAPCSRTTARAMPPPAARSTAPISPISPSSMRRKGIPAARRLDRRAEGAADRPRAGACRPARRHDRLRAGPAARRGGGPSRSGAPHRALWRRSSGSARRSG